MPGDFLITTNLSLKRYLSNLYFHYFNPLTGRSQSDRTGASPATQCPPQGEELNPQPAELGIILSCLVTLCIPGREGCAVDERGLTDDCAALLPLAEFSGIKNHLSGREVDGAGKVGVFNQAVNRRCTHRQKMDHLPHTHVTASAVSFERRAGIAVNVLTRLPPKSVLKSKGSP